MHVTNVAPTAKIGGADRIAEGSSYRLDIAARVDPGADTITGLRVDWGDGAAPMLLATALDQPLSLSHLFADDASARRIQVYATDEDGEFLVGEKTVAVTNVDPTIALSGASQTGTNWAWALGLGGITDPGTDSVNRYVIDWGDATSSTIDAPGLPGQLTHAFAKPGTYTVQVSLRDEDGVHVGGTISVKVHDVLRVGDGPSVVTRTSEAQMAAAWNKTGYVLSQTADFTAATVQWSAVTLATSGGGTLAGGDMLLGDLGVSGQVLNTGGGAQEIDGTEALRVQLPGAADGLRFNLTRLTAEAGGYLEAGRVLLYRNGQQVGERAFEASGVGSDKLVTLAADTPFDTVVFEAGDTDAQGRFRPGAVASALDPARFGSDPLATSQTRLGSEFTLDWLEVTLVADAPASTPSPFAKTPVTMEADPGASLVRDGGEPLMAALPGASDAALALDRKLVTDRLFV